VALCQHLRMWLASPPVANAAFQQRAANATTDTAKARFEFYGNSSLLCGSEDGYPT
jgi:photosystem I subunit 3